MVEVKMVNAIFTGGWASDVHESIAKFLKDTPDNYSKKSYYYRPKEFQNFSEEEYKIFTESEEFKNLKFFGSQHITMSQEDFIAAKFDANNDERLRSESTFKVNAQVSATNIFDMIETHTALMTKQFEQLTKLSTQTFNEKVVVPNMDSFISKINQTMLLEDCCTDYLQQHLSKGWRIIAICPQPNQRRPDYVLGKILDEEELRSSALRGD